MSKFDFKEAIKDDRPDDVEKGYQKMEGWDNKKPVLLDYPCEWFKDEGKLRVRFHFRGWRELAIDESSHSYFFLGAQGSLTVSESTISLFSTIRESAAYASLGLRLQMVSETPWILDVSGRTVADFMASGAKGSVPPALFFRERVANPILGHFAVTLFNLIRDHRRPIAVVGDNPSYESIARQFRWSIRFYKMGTGIEIDVDDVFLSLASPVFLNVPQKVFISTRPFSYYFLPGKYGYMVIDQEILELSSGDRAELDTYHETMVAKEMIIYNSASIQEIVQKNKGRIFSFPGDGAGTGAKVCQDLKQRFISGDICPRSPLVERETMISTINRTPEDAIVILSFVMAFLSDQELSCLGQREVYCVDRHKLDKWCYQSSDHLVSGNSGVQLVAMRDNSSVVPPPAFQMFLNNKRDGYKVLLDRTDLISLLRFLSLHDWRPQLDIPIALREVARTYGYEHTSLSSQVISNDPLHHIDFFNGVTSDDRVMVNGVPAACHINHVLVLPANPACEGSYSNDGYHYLRFREAGDVSFMVDLFRYTVRVHPFVSLKSLGKQLTGGRAKKKRKKTGYDEFFERIVPKLGTCETVRAWDYRQE